MAVGHVGHFGVGGAVGSAKNTCKWFPLFYVRVFLRWSSWSIHSLKASSKVCKAINSASLYRHTINNQKMRSRGGVCSPKNLFLSTLSGKPGMHEISFQEIHIRNRSINKERLLTFTQAKWSFKLHTRPCLPSQSHFLLMKDLARFHWLLLWLLDNPSTRPEFAMRTRKDGQTARNLVSALRIQMKIPIMLFMQMCVIDSHKNVSFPFSFDLCIPTKHRKPTYYQPGIPG